ncbi:hypothetical protein ACLOJK_006521 [Asimina triloba]
MTLDGNEQQTSKTTVMIKAINQPSSQHSDPRQDGQLASQNQIRVCPIPSDHQQQQADDPTSTPFTARGQRSMSDQHPPWISHRPPTSPFQNPPVRSRICPSDPSRPSHGRRQQGKTHQIRKSSKYPTERRQRGLHPHFKHGTAAYVPSPNTDEISAIRSNASCIAIHAVLTCRNFIINRSTY